MKVVKVYGALRKKLGQCRFEFHAETPAQALKALCVNFPGLEKWLIDSEQNGVSYRVTVGREHVGDENLHVLGCPWSEKEVFSITPMVAGAGDNPFTTIAAGIGLIALAVVTGGASIAFSAGGFGLAAGATATFATSMAIVAGNIGVALVLGGIAQAIAPSPVTSGNVFERGREAARLESFSFSGIVNTAKQGLPVPIAYGRLFVGSAVISSGLDVEGSPNSDNKTDLIFLRKG